MKQVIVVRKDLNMRKGKIASQVAHGSLGAVLSVAHRKRNEYIIPITEDGKLTPLGEWLEGRFTKICVSVNSEAELLDIYNQALEAGVICSLITDSGLTEFNGVPTNTVVALGPDLPENIDAITGKLPLL